MPLDDLDPAAMFSGHRDVESGTVAVRVDHVDTVQQRIVRRRLQPWC